LDNSFLQVIFTAVKVFLELILDSPYTLSTLNRLFGKRATTAAEALRPRIQCGDEREGAKLGFDGHV